MAKRECGHPSRRRFICTIRDGLATARPARLRAPPQDEDL
jgi:hypothetical protein